MFIWLVWVRRVTTGQLWYAETIVNRIDVMVAHTRERWRHRLVWYLTPPDIPPKIETLNFVYNACPRYQD